MDGVTRRLRKEMEEESHLCLGSGVFIEDRWSAVRVP